MWGSTWRFGAMDWEACRRPFNRGMPAKLWHVRAWTRMCDVPITLLKGIPHACPWKCDKSPCSQPSWGPAPRYQGQSSRGREWQKDGGMMGHWQSVWDLRLSQSYVWNLQNVASFMFLSCDAWWHLSQNRVLNKCWRRDQDLHNSTPHVCCPGYKNRHNIIINWRGYFALAIYSLIEMAHKMLGLRGILQTTDTPTPSFIDDKTGSKI